jgi:YHS domain-containing protein
MDKKAQWALVGAAWFLSLTVAGLGWLAWERFGKAAADPSQAFIEVSGGRVRCPVTGESVMAVSATPHVDLGGQTYYFSAALDGEGHDARTRFLMDPDKYLHPSSPAP